MKKAVYNFHLPLNQDLYEELRAEADQSGQPATELARQAIRLWLKKRARQKRHREMAIYVQEMIGTDADLDPAFEAAAIEHWLEHDKISIE